MSVRRAAVLSEILLRCFYVNSSHGINITFQNECLGLPCAVQDILQFQGVDIDFKQVALGGPIAAAAAAAVAAEPAALLVPGAGRRALKV